VVGFWRKYGRFDRSTVPNILILVVLLVLSDFMILPIAVITNLWFWEEKDNN
jgi:hypothetical protein